MNKISYSAPAKIILSGEHSVVYGKPGLASAIDKRLIFTVDEGNRKHDKHIDIIISIVENYLRDHNITNNVKPFTVTTSSEIPSGRGLGSSAALSVAGCAALVHYITGKPANKSLVNQLAYKAEKHFHRNPSGLDNSTSCFGGLVYYRKEFEFLKNISTLGFKVPKKIQDTLFLIDTGKPLESTGEMVAAVGRRYNENPKKYEMIFSEIEKVTKRMVLSITTENLKMFSDAVDENQKLLDDIGVVSDKARKLLLSLKELGTGKILGGGGVKEGVGYILFVTKNTHEANEYLSKHKIAFMKFKQDFQGVK